MAIDASGVLDFLLNRTALWVGGLRKVGIDLQRRHIGLHRVVGFSDLSRKETIFLRRIYTRTGI